MAEDDVTPDSDATPQVAETVEDGAELPPAEVVIDGVTVVGTIPVSAQVREGWFRSPGGVLAHADGPSQVRAFVDRGYTAVDEADAVKEVGDGITLTVDSATADTFDAESVAKAVRDESTKRPTRKRAPRKAAPKPPSATPPAGDSPPPG